MGLGNIWGFPTQVGQGGGAAFVVIYLLCVTVICLPIMVGELAIGRRTLQSPVGSFSNLKPRTPWWLVGGLGVLTGAGILSFYSVIAGWTIAYIWFTLTGQVGGDQQSAGRILHGVHSQTPSQHHADPRHADGDGVGHRGGSTVGNRTGHQGVDACPDSLASHPRRSGRHAAGRSRRPGLLPSARIRPRLLDLPLYRAALGQAFFSLSLGMGTMITYGSYLAKREGIAAAALWVVLLDTSIALLAGFIIFPSGFSIPGFDPSSSGPGLIFTVLPRLFATLPGGQLFGAAFFVLLTLAALTSTISLLEVPVAHCVDALGWSRRRAVAIVTTGVFALAIPSALGNGAVPFLSAVPIVQLDFLTLMATIWNDFALPIGGLLTALFIGWAWRVDKALEALCAHNAWFPASGAWGFLIRWICPLGILSIVVPVIVSML